MRALFWAFIAAVFWHYIGYGLMLLLLVKLRRAQPTPSLKTWPKVSVIIAAYNEERVIARRIENCLALDYPRERLEILVGSDGSTDRTVEIAKQFESQGVKILAFPINRGRSQVHNDCVRAASGEILCFTDADTLYEPDCLQKLVRHYADPKVGCVGGELQSSSFQQGALGGGQGLYWRWEYALRRWQSALGVLTKVSGANMSMRKALYQELPKEIDIDQAAGPMVILQGYRVVHDPEAIAYEEFPTHLQGEFATRKRLTIRALTALWYYRQLLNPIRYPRLAFHLFSYRVLRYAVPFLLIGALLLNLLLWGSGTFFKMTLLLQASFYGLAVAGFLLDRRGMRSWIFAWPFAFCWFNLGLLAGSLEFLLGRRVQAYNPNEIDRVD